MTTIKDVAKHAKVSVTAVSYAINGTGTISDETRKHILQVAKELNYHPNAFARNLKKRKTSTIGVFITSFGGSFYEEILEGIHDAVIQTDYEMIVCPESWTKRKVLTQRQVDGAIVFDWKIDSDTILKLASKKFPIVVLDRHLESDYLFPMLLDNKHGAREAFYHLYEQGARRLALVTGASDSFDNEERTRAFLEEAEKNSVAVSRYKGNFTEKSGYQVAQAIIESQELPDAVFCNNDQMAIGFMRAMKEHNLSAPEDIGVVGFDDIKIAKYLQPSLTTVGMSRFSWGAAAANQLIDVLENDSDFPKAERIPTKLIPRESSTKNYGGK
ncbi:MAG: LacI family DNA-binding transcriptional regulator [Ardenticatenaceae bacterium]|nr:LacI family DNA-binding transcriptional regulator [Ardenticatenaceae bacterium]